VVLTCGDAAEVGVVGVADPHAVVGATKADDRADVRQAARLRVSRSDVERAAVTGRGEGDVQRRRRVSREAALAPLVVLLCEVADKGAGVVECRDPARNRYRRWTRTRSCKISESMLRWREERRRTVHDPVLPLLDQMGVAPERAWRERREAMRHALAIGTWNELREERRDRLVGDVAEHRRVDRRLEGHDIAA
jgi:hypothetical protein